MDRFFRIVSKDIDDPIIQYLSLDSRGWLWETVSIQRDRLAEIEVAPKDWALSVEPLEVDEIEESWDTGEARECSRAEYLAIKALVKRSR